jgi:hypothetical protein
MTGFVRKAAMTTVAAAALMGGAAGLAQAEDRDVMVVFDASGSMWGDIGGKTKIETAREVLRDVLPGIKGSYNMGMIAYGHREKGQCGDIEMVVAPRPVDEARAELARVAGGLQPKGKTPLTEAVRMAAEAVKYTESAATVILITDGIETCNADPCALGRELERNGVNFTAHVVGFGLSAREGRQVACLAEETGGKYFPASDAGELNAALNKTFDPAPVPEPVYQGRQVRFRVYTNDSDKHVNARAMARFDILPGAPDLKWQNFKTHYEGDATATALMDPGQYTALLQIKVGNKASKTRLNFTVEPGEGVQYIDLAQADGTLRVLPYISADEPAPVKDFRSATGGFTRATFTVFPVVDGVVQEDAGIRQEFKWEGALPAGTYLVRGLYGRHMVREELVDVAGRETTDLNFNFALSRVFLDVRDKDGFPPERAEASIFDSPNGAARFQKGYAGPYNGSDNKAWFLPQGTWRFVYSPKPFGEVIVNVPGQGENLSVAAPVGQQPAYEDLPAVTRCLRDPVEGPWKGLCLYESVNPATGEVIRAREYADRILPWAEFYGNFTGSGQTFRCLPDGSCTGTFLTTGKDEGVFEGTIDANNVLTGRWAYKDKAGKCATAWNGMTRWGRMVVRFSDNADSFKLAYNNCDAEPKGEKYGKRRLGSFLEDAPAYPHVRSAAAPAASASSGNEVGNGKPAQSSGAATDWITGQPVQARPVTCEAFMGAITAARGTLSEADMGKLRDVIAGEGYASAPPSDDAACDTVAKAVSAAGLKLPGL